MEKSKLINEVTKVVNYYEILSKTSRHDLLSRLMELDKYSDDLQELNDGELASMVFDLTVSREQKRLFKQYTDYVYKKTVGSLLQSVSVIDSELTEIIDIYGSNDDIRNEILKLEELRRKLGRNLINYPFIRAKIAYSNMMSSFDSYRKKDISHGLAIGKKSDLLEKKKGKGLIARTLATGDIRKLKSEISTMKKQRKVDAKENFEKYSKVAHEYNKVMTWVFMEVLKNKEMKRAVVYTVDYIYDTSYAKVLDNGMKYITDEELVNIDNKELLKYFTLFIKIEDVNEFSGELFEEKMKEFVLYFYSKRIELLETKKSSNLSKIKLKVKSQTDSVNNLKKLQDLLLQNLDKQDDFMDSIDYQEIFDSVTLELKK